MTHFDEKRRDYPDIKERLTSLEVMQGELVVRLDKVIDDHENRIRTLETTSTKWVARAGMFGAIVAGVGTWLLSKIGWENFSG